MSVNIDYLDIATKLNNVTVTTSGDNYTQEASAVYNPRKNFHYPAPEGMKVLVNYPWMIEFEKATVGRIEVLVEMSAEDFYEVEHLFEDLISDDATDSIRWRVLDEKL